MEEQLRQVSEMITKSSNIPEDIKSIVESICRGYIRTSNGKISLSSIKNVCDTIFVKIDSNNETFRGKEKIFGTTDTNYDKKNVFILREIVKLRNAVAHNSCVLCDLDKKDNNYAPDYKIINYLNDCGIRKETRDNKLGNSRIRQITYTLYMFNEIVTSTGVKVNVNQDIDNLFYNRINLHKEYYNNNELLKSIYAYFDKIIKKHYSV